MGILLQISIPLAVTLAALILIAVLRKYIKLEVIAVCTVVLALSVGGIVLTFKQANDDNSLKKGSDSMILSLCLADSYMKEGNYDAAEDILADLSEHSADDIRVMVASARLALLKGDYGTALTLYENTGRATEEEKGYAMNLWSQGVANDNAIIKYLTKKGFNPSDYGLTKVEIKSISYDEVKTKILSAIDEDIEGYKKKLGKDAKSVLDYISTVLEKFNSLVDTGYSDKDGLDDALSGIEKIMKKNKSFNGNLHLRLALLKGYTANGDYDKIAASAGENTTADELVVITELYTKGLVERKDFSKEYVAIDKDKVKEIAELCKDIVKENKGDIPEEKYDKYKEQIDHLKNQTDDTVAFALREDLLTKASSGSDEMKSKSYLALAKLENHVGNDALADMYIEEAMGTSSLSDDDNYRIPMSQLTSIVQGTADSSEVKNVAIYVDNALNNSLSEGFKAEAFKDNSSSGDNEDGEKKNSFSTEMTNKINESTATINIGVINKTGFPNVEARIQVQSNKWTTLEELKNNLIVYDCGSKIEDFTLEKLTFQKSRIILLCDISGSMSGSERNLKDAVVSFAQKMKPGEEVAVIGFSGSVEFITPFSSDKDTVASYADRLNTSGGTALYNSLMESLDLLTQDVNVNNIIIAMTDGQDGNSITEYKMYNEMGAKAAERGVTVYTLGLGQGVDTDYLSMMADSGNGSFLYAEDKEKLENFYDFIHGQLSNQYVLKYTAKNKTKNERKLEISVNEEIGAAEKLYYLKDREYSDEGKDSYNPYTVVDGEITVYGLSAKFLYKSSSEQTLYLRGTGFDSGDDVSLRISGNVKYTLKAEYMDSETYKVTIPPEVANGVYDVNISIADYSTVLESELSIAVPGTQKNFRFGSYNFTALSSYVDESGATVLSGNVVMNGWLFFKGDLKITNRYGNSDRVWIEDNSGAYISYSTALSQGLAKNLAEKGISVSLGKLNSFCLYGDKYTPGEYESFPVEKIYVGEELNILFLVVENFNMAIYPDVLIFQGMNFHYDLPFQKQLMRNFDIGGYEKINIDSDMLFGATEIAFRGKVEYSNDDEPDFTMVSLPLVMDKFTVEIDTLKNDYLLEGGVKFKALKDMLDGIEFSFGVKSGRFDSIGLKATGIDVPIISTPIPVSIGDFGYSLDGFSGEESDKNLLDRLLKTVVNVEFSVDVASLNAYLPKIAKLIDGENVALATLDNCKLSLPLSEFRLSFEADLVLATVLDVGKCRISMGKYDYTNELLGYYDEAQYGLQAAITLGSTYEFNNLSLQLDATGEVTVGYPYTGIYANGNADFDLNWLIFKKDFDVAGDFLIGAYKNTSDNLQFSVIVRGTNTNGEYSGFHLYITRKSGLGVYTY